MKQISTFDEIIVDNFAGGGGASTGIEMAIGHNVDIAINHDPAAIAMHKANHPETEHYCENVWEVNPIKAVRGRSVGLAWFSPDCKHFSKAKGGKPCNKKIRGLAWIVLKWAALVKPRVIMLENVEEFQTWGPLNRRKHPIKSKKGETYWKWRNQLEALGYKIDTKELIAADYGAPTKRKRFFMIARCDGEEIKWPKHTHGNRNSEEVQMGLLKPYVPAADIIDWSIPCKSIFGRKKPLVEKTMRRISLGIQKFVLENPEPFIMQIGQTGFTKERNKSIHEPLTTIVSKAEHCLVTPYLIQYHSETTKKGVRGQSIKEPIMTLDSSPRY
ncbi:MAG: methyltransferase [Anaerocolumna sp.]|jgi:DNA (cytosine-5)-methyltransferase 1|nr:methyltransferase [Anaerocolumna sp.]